MMENNKIINFIRLNFGFFLFGIFFVILFRDFLYTYRIQLEKFLPYYDYQNQIMFYLTGDEKYDSMWDGNLERWIENGGKVIQYGISEEDNNYNIVPGGKAIYPSSLLMTAIPALVAGVRRRVVVSPISDLDKSSIVLAAAYVAEVTDFICMGGAHSIGALAYGTETISPVNKIVGPGNAYVAEAKRQVFGKVGIDSIAGPSEVLIVADKTANPNYVAIDLLSQAEHDEQAQAILLTNDLELAQNVQVSIERFLKELPRSKIASSSWNDFGSIILVENFDEAIDLVNEVAPEHLQLMTSNAENLLKKIKNAGAIFIGHYTPEAVGDYIAGPNHVLPTNGTAKFSSGLGVLDFCKRTTIVEFNKNNLDAIGKNVVTLAKAEGLEAHAMSVALRLNNK